MHQSHLSPSPAAHLQGGLADSLYAAARDTPDLPQLARRPEGRSTLWTQVTAAELWDEVVDVARGFVRSGIRPGDRVAIMSRTRYEWTVFGYALWSVGAEIVPVYPTSSHDQVAWILRDAHCVGVVVEDEQGVMTVGSACAALPFLRHVWQFDAGALDRLVERGRAIPVTAVDSLRRIVLPDSTAVIAYTSGTTGTPKGCALTHRSLASPCDTVLEGWGHTAAPPGEQPAVLAFLPFSHAYGLMVQGVCLRGGILMGHEPDLREEALSEAMLSFRPTYLYAVPFVFEKIYKNFLRASQRAGRGALFERAARTAQDFALAEERLRLGTGPGPGIDLKLQHSLYERTVYRRLRGTLGGRVCGAVSGGSPLNRELALFFAGIGILVHDGYGLTETSGGITAQPVGREKFGTVGRAHPGTQIRVDDDGEILVWGPSVFQGYVNDEEATRAAFRSGWLATGDVGRIDTEGYLTITGRKKDIIITSGGKSVAPAALEERLRAHPLIHQAAVVGDNRPCVGALITLDPEFVTHWRASRAGRD
ncbi:AMP-dependent synthetase/ligase, partial [Streptomyces sp. NPDC055056]